MQSKPTQITIRRGPDRGAQVRLTPELITGQSTWDGPPEVVFRWKVECMFHDTMRRARDRRDAESLARSIGTWCEDCRSERSEERD